MNPTIYPVSKIDKGTLSIMPKPRSGEWIDDEFAGLCELGIDKIISLLEIEEAHDVGLEAEELFCTKNSIAFTQFPIPDRGVPDLVGARSLAQALLAEIRLGLHIAVQALAAPVSLLRVS